MVQAASISAMAFMCRSASAFCSKKRTGETRCGELASRIFIAARGVSKNDSSALPSGPAKVTTHPAQQCVLSHVCQLFMFSAFGFEAAA